MNNLLFLPRKELNKWKMKRKYFDLIEFDKPAKHHLTHTDHSCHIRYEQNQYVRFICRLFFLMMKEKPDNFIFYVSFISIHLIATHMPQCQFSSQNRLGIDNNNSHSNSSKMICYCFVSFQWTFKYNIIIFVYAFDVWRSMFLFLHIIFFFRSFAFFALIFV